MKAFLSLLLLLLCSCSTPRPASHVLPDTPTNLAAEFHPLQHKGTTPHDRDILLAAQCYLIHADKWPKNASRDAYYRLRHTADGYAVFVIYVTGFAGEQPQFTPCVHNEVFLRADGTVTKVLSGPECWPNP